MNKLILTILAMLLIPSFASGGVIWEENFDGFKDWGQPYRARSVGVPISCTVENPVSKYCTSYGPPPGGNFNKFYGWYMSPAEYDPPTGNGIHVDGRNHRGATGKAFTLHDFYFTSPSGGGQLLIALPNTTGYEELYVRYWIKYQPGYTWTSGPGVSSVQKLGHISHYLYNNQPYTFFTTGGFHPTSVPVITKYTDGKADLALDFSPRTDPSYSLVSGKWGYFDIPGDSYPIGNGSGTGTDFDTPGMIGDSGWHCLEFYLKNNSAPGAADGIAKLWLDGNIQQSHANIMWREASSPLGQGIWNFVHIGGNSQFESASKLEQWRAIDDVVIYTPITSSDPQWLLSPQDGRLPMDYVITGTTPAEDVTPPETTATPPAGTYTGAQTVKLAPSETITIYYTTDGSTPTTSSAVYSGPILIDKSLTLKYFAIDVGGNRETVKTSAYTIVAPPPTTNATVNVSGRFSVR